MEVTWQGEVGHERVKVANLKVRGQTEKRSWSQVEELTWNPLPVDGTNLGSPPNPFVQPLKAVQHFHLKQPSA